jgi:S-DNA-T family DNA segregation ATPase FtsK/SpoIIIE
VIDWWQRAEPPGGWLVFALIVLGVTAAVGLAVPEAPPGRALRLGLGGGILLALAWPAWLVWVLVRRRSTPVSHGLALLGLSAAWLTALAAHETGSGGSIGDALLGVLDTSFGRVGGLLLLAGLVLIAVVVLVGTHRVIAGARTALGQLRRRTAAPRRSAIRIAGARRTALEPTATAPRRASDVVILGPGSPERQPARDAADAPAADRGRLVIEPHSWQRPEPSILAVSTEGATFSPADLKARARVIEDTLASFNVRARVIEIQQGPAITQFGLDPAPGVAVNRIVSRQNDLALRLGAPTLRVLAPVPGRPLVGLEVPNASVATVTLGDLITAPSFARGRLPIGLGMDVAGKPVVADLTRMPHLLVAGATGSGKSVCINSLIASLLVARTPEEVQLVLVDPKQVEMSQYKELPHLRLPVVTDMDRVVASLRWTVLEMERRYTRFSEVGARNIVAFNERFPAERLNYLVIVIDELADMMMSAAEDVERQICRLAQLGRAAGVHLVVATQRPSVDVLTGLIKANLPTRIAFAVSSQTDSRVILDRTGAERLLGRGDGLYQAGDEMNPRRFQGAFTSDDEIEALCSFWRAQGVSNHTPQDEADLERLARQEDPEERLLEQARELADEHDGDVSVSYLQRKLKIGHQKAVRIHQTLIADEAAAHSTAED